jgi:hypothetical protein
MVTGKKTRTTKRELRVVFDTNPLYTASPHELINADTRKLIEINSVHHDLKISWHVPEVVINERHYQMRNHAIELLPAFHKITAVLGIPMPLTPDELPPKVTAVINSTLLKLKIAELKLDHAAVEWKAIIDAATSREPPFQPGKSEKGFRDAIVLETFAQLVEASPSSSARCRLVLVTGDDRLKEAAKARLGQRANAEVVPSLEELQNLINVLISTAEETFVKKMREKAKNLFFVPGNGDTYWYREKVSDKILEKCGPALQAIPQGADRRELDGIEIASPRFLRKEGQRMHWSSQVHYRAAVYQTTSMPAGRSIDLFAPTGNLANPLTVPSITLPPLTSGLSLMSTGDTGGLRIPGSIELSKSPLSISSLYGQAGTGPTIVSTNTFPTTTSTLLKKGVTVIEVQWSATVDTHGKLVRPSIDDISVVETTWDT